MADKVKEPEDNEEPDLEVEGGKDKKKKKGSGFLFTILKWVAIVIGTIVLMVTVVIITMKIMGANASSQAVIPVSAEYTSKREQLSWYTSINEIRTRTSDTIPASVMVKSVLGYKLEDKTTSAELTARQVEIQDFLRRYFTAKTQEELAPRNEEKLRIEIRNGINDDILTMSKIQDVRFTTLEVTPQ
jgi:flagellar FliL protein